MYSSMTRGKRNARVGGYNIAVYLRISQDDGTDMESNSIKNQREIIKSYISGRDDFKDALLVDYVDDGISGSHSEREAYRRLLYDIEHGDIDCVIVKDLPRIGRNLIDVDDLLMNHLVTLNVRFIAINNGYDSFTHPLSNLELAVISLANQHYNRDLAMKSITSRHVKAKRGEYLFLPPLGYMKSNTEKNKLIIDEEAANYVRLIFSLAVSGHRTVEIAQILNAQGVPSPSVYKTSHGRKNIWTHAVDENYCFWTNGVVRKLLMNEVYLGKAIANKSRVTQPGTGRSEPRPREEWIIVPDAHEAIISEDDFQKAQAILSRVTYDETPGHIFGSKVKCPACGHAMIRYTKKNPRFKCGTAKFTDHYGCQGHTILQSALETTVLSAIRVCADALLDREEIKLTQIQKSKLSASDLDKKIAAEIKAIELLEVSVTKIFTKLASGKITKDVFLHKKDIINDTIARKRSEIEKWDERLRTLTEGRDAVESAIAELESLRTLDTLNREIVNLLIDRILVHSESNIEIVWNGRFSE